MAGVAISQDVLEARADALLAEWGECQRRTPSPIGPKQGRSTIATMIENWGSRTRKRKQAVWSRHRRLTEVAVGYGKVRRVPILPMYPDRAERQTDVGIVERSEPWPERIQRLDRVLARLPQIAVRVALAYYAGGHSIRSGADALAISKALFERQLERVRWAVIGAFPEIDR